MAADPQAGARLLAAAQALCDELTAVGIPANLDAGQVMVPGAWVSPRSLVIDRLDGGGTLTAHVFLVAADTDEATALRLLAGMLDIALAVVEPNDDDEIDTAGSVVLPHTPGTALPAFRIVTDLLT